MQSQWHVLAQDLTNSLHTAYLEVRNDKSETNWLLLDYESDRSDKLKLAQTGTGGLSELKEVLDDSKASYAYVRVSYSNDKESTREKFILVVRRCLQIRTACPLADAHVFHSRVTGVDWAKLQSNEEGQGEQCRAAALTQRPCGSYRDPHSKLTGDPACARSPYILPTSRTYCVSTRLRSQRERRTI